MTVEVSDRSSRAAERPAPGAAAASALFLLIAAAGCGLDLLTKHWVLRWRGQPEQQPIWWLWDGLVGIETSLNRGALFGMGQGRVLWFALLSVLALLGIACWLLRGGASHDRWLTLSLACATGGILGNLYDRLGLWSISAAGWPQDFAVRDWIRVSYGQRVWPNFNVADSLLVCGALLLFWKAFRAPQAAAIAPQAESDASAAPRSRTG